MVPGEKTSSAPHGSPKKGKKYFTLEEANRALPYVSRIVGEITEAYRQAMGVRVRMEVAAPGQEGQRLQAEYEVMIDRLNGLLEELEHVGVELKDFEKGLLDFPAVHQGREIYLCWKQGEDRITAWHEKEAGFAGRQDVGMLQGG